MMEKGTSNIMSDIAHTHVTNVMRLSLYLGLSERKKYKQLERYMTDS
jgi:hypothetical protein